VDKLHFKKIRKSCCFNRFLFQQELKPYRNKQIECNHKNLELLKMQAEEIEYWLLVKKIAEKDTKTGKELCSNLVYGKIN